MRSVLELDGLGDRVEAYARLRADGIAPSPDGRPVRAEGGPSCGPSHCEARWPAATRCASRDCASAPAAVLGELPADGLLTSDSPKGAVRVAFPVHAVPFLFPGMYPEGVAGEPVTVAVTPKP